MAGWDKVKGKITQHESIKLISRRPDT